MGVDDEDLDDDVREMVENSARFLYGLIHARYIVTSRGLSKMVSPRIDPSALSHPMALMTILPFSLATFDSYALLSLTRTGRQVP